MKRRRRVGVHARRTTAVIGALMAGGVMACAPRAAGTNSASVPSPWVLVWREEFNGPVGSRVDSTKWRHDLGDGCAVGICGWGNTEKEFYTNASENVALDGHGHLIIVARTAPSGLACYYGACRYTSAKITTHGRMLGGPGRVEARIKLPAGQGLWPAFWMLGASHPGTPWPKSGELDIMENKGSESTTTSSAVHGPGYSGQTPFAHRHPLRAGASADGFHTYAVEWDSLHIRFLVDGGVHYVATRREVDQRGPWVFDQPFFVILNLAVGGHFDGDPASDAIFPATMLVDYVRVYAPAP